MKKIVFALFLLFSFCNSYSQITYTPQTAAGYQFKYVKSDSGFALPFIDTSLRRGVNRIGAVVARPQDSLLYYWTGAKWSKINADVSGLISLINSKVDSVTVYGNDLKYWINGVAVQYSLNTYLGNLQTVTNNGNTTTNDIQVNRLQANAAITATQINASDYLFRTLTNNAFADSLRGYIKGDSLTHNNLNWYLPDTTGTFVLRINGVAPDKNGNVTGLFGGGSGLFGGGSGSLDTTTIYNNIALKLNIADSANYATQYEINTTNNQVTANTASITQRPTYSQLTDSLDWFNNGTNIYNKNAGNVGIGTASPGTKLEVNGTTKTTNLTIGDNPQGVDIGASKNGFNAYFNTTSTAIPVSIMLGTTSAFSKSMRFQAYPSSYSSSGIEIADNGALFTVGMPLNIGTYTSGNLNFWTGNGPRMSIASSGEVSIANLSSNGYVKTSGGTGLLSVSTSIPQADVTNLTTDLAAKLSNITGLVTAGTNITLSGGGTIGSPYVINASGGGSGLTYSQTKSIANK